MINQEENNDSLYGKSKMHNIPIDHLDFKYVEKCSDIKELEKIYKVLASGAEGKYLELENFVADKIKKLAPNSRALRKDLPIINKSSISKDEQKNLDEEINSFIKNIPNMEEKITTSEEKNDLNNQVPPIRNPVILNISKKDQKTQVLKSEAPKPSSKKVSMPKDYKEWEKIEKELEKELDEKENVEDKDDKKKKEPVKVITDQSQINTNDLTKKLVKNLKKNVNTEDLTEEQKVSRADMEKCKGNEAYNSGCFEEALVYYTRSIQFLPNAASYNNRAMTYIKLEKWDKVIEDCEYVLKYENSNVKAKLRRATAYLKKKKFIEAKQDLDACLKVEPNNKKAIELNQELENKLKNHEEEKVKLNGANRLLIEDTDGSSSEEEEEVEEIHLKDNKPKKNEEIIEIPLHKTSIKISEVDEDDEETDESESESEIETNNKENVSLNPEPKEKVVLELPQNIATIKDEAFKQFSSGQYGSACELYGKAIDNLKEISSNTNKQELHKYFKTTLVILINNKAACSQKIGDYKACIKDCNIGLEMIDSLVQKDSDLANELRNQRLKFISKKASSYEFLEKYLDAFNEYEILMKLDSTFQNAQQSYNRIRKILNETGQLQKKKNNEIINLTNSEIKNQIKTEDSYEDYKSKGNECVKQNDFSNALKFYNKCIEIDKLNPIAYLNRSLCYVKLNKPDLAIDDCSFVLQNDKANVKALFRRATANKMKNMNNLVADDLKLLLTIEPNNQIAIKEYESVKKLIDEQKNLNKAPSKKIELIDKPTILKNEPIVEKETIKVNLPKKNEPEQISSIKVKKAENFTNVSNAYEFLQSWNSINPKDKEGYDLLLSSIDPSYLPKFIGSKLDDDMLVTLIGSIYNLSKKVDCKAKTLDYLRQLGNTQRFNVTKLFLATPQVNMLKEIVKNYDQSDANFIKNLYGF